MKSASVTQPPSSLINAAKRLSVIEQYRIRQENMLNALKRIEFGVIKDKDITTEQHDQFIATFGGTDYFGASVTQFDEVEKFATNTIERLVLESPFYDFITMIDGLSWKSFGRLWATIGNPLINSCQNESRSVGQLFQYAGVGDPTDKRTKGRKLNHSIKVGAPLHVIAENIGVKTQGKYRDIYDVAKSERQGRLHTLPCSPCGTQSPESRADEAALKEAGIIIRKKNDVPATSGTPWKPGHIHGHSLRIVKREFLRDVFTEAKYLNS